MLLYGAESRTPMLGFIGHCWRTKDESIFSRLLWEHTHGKRSRGRSCYIYVDQPADRRRRSGQAKLEKANGRQIKMEEMIKDARVHSRYK